MNTQNKENINFLNKEEKKKNREYEKSDMPFTDTGKEPGNPELEKTFDSDDLSVSNSSNDSDSRETKTQIEGERYGNNENPDKEFSKEQYKVKENSDE